MERGRGRSDSSRGMERGRGRSGSSHGMLRTLALKVVHEYWRLDRKPPVTTGLLAANALVYLRPGILNRILPHIDQVWFNPHLILKHRDLKRFFLSAFYHQGESHLGYNMISLLWKGKQLETSMGSGEFALMMSALLSLSQGVTLLLAKSLLLLFDYRRAYYKEYAVGFSGVLFAMKVVLNSPSNNYSNIYGLVVPARHAAWAELIFIQLLVPGASCLGHLGGILAGLVYLKVKASYSGSDPLTPIARCVARVVSWPFRFLLGFSPFRTRRISGRGILSRPFRFLLGFSPFRRLRILGRGIVGRSRRSTSDTWRCQACTCDNSSMLTVCEICGTGRDDASLGSSNYFHDLPLEELRRRRVQ